MTQFKRILLAALSSLTVIAPAQASANGSAFVEKGSFIYLGKPLNCSVDTCPAPEPMAAKEPAARPMVDSFGMPTNMPTVLRGGQNSEAAAAAPAPVKETPAAQPSAPAPAAAPAPEPVAAPAGAEIR